MADISITAANVAIGTTGTPETGTGTAGETITAGQPVYLKSSDSRLWKADCNVSTAEAEVVGVALHGSLAGQPLKYQKSGEITIGATIAAAETYILSATAGGIAPVADLASSSYLTRIGYGKTTAIMVLDIRATGIAKA